jgi:tetratricopeptide (TPR) repeat protein
MNNHHPPKFIITAIAIVSAFCFVDLLFARESKVDSSVGNIFDIKQDQAIKYRELGLEYQQRGNLAEALSFYQKAIAIYPDFAAACNDIGVVYEAMGFVDRAEESYLKAIKINPAYASAYTNLALLYEGQRNFEKAAYYWGKRIEVGAQDDPWTQKAANRLRDIRSSLSGKPFSDEREEEVLGLMKDIAGDKTELNKNSETLAQAHFKKAKLSFNRGDMATAIKEALDAQYLDQDNPEIEAFIEKVEQRALTR